MKGFKTIAFGALVALGPAALDFLGGIDWTSVGVSPLAGSIIGTGIIALRAVTNTGIGKGA